MKYPIGIQSFDQLIEDGYVYVDKTDLVYKLTHEGKIYFLSRPRRFGKSLLVSTLENYYLGRKELFRGLAIDGLETEWAVHPVFHVDFNGGNFANPGELEQKINFYLTQWEQQYNLPVRTIICRSGRMNWDMATVLSKFWKQRTVRRAAAPWCLWMSTTSRFWTFWTWTPAWRSGTAMC